MWCSSHSISFLALLSRHQRQHLKHSRLAFFFAKPSTAGAPTFPDTHHTDYGSIDIPIMPGNAGRRARHMRGCGRFYMDRRICPNCGATVYQFSRHASQTCRTCKHNFVWKSEPEVVPAKPPAPRPLGQSDSTLTCRIGAD